MRSKSTSGSRCAPVRTWPRMLRRLSAWAPDTACGIWTRSSERALPHRAMYLKLRLCKLTRLLGKAGKDGKGRAAARRGARLTGGRWEGNAVARCAEVRLGEVRSVL